MPAVIGTLDDVSGAAPRKRPAPWHHGNRRDAIRKIQPTEDRAIGARWPIEVSPGADPFTDQRGK